MKIRILESAQQDLIEGYSFYEMQEIGVGNYFLESIFSDVESLRLFAGIHSIHFDKYHRLLSKRFPFAIDTDILILNQIAVGKIYENFRRN
jgi:hypothetical protein